MALYGALSDAFGELNRLLIGQQEHKGRMALTQAQNKRSDMALQSQLQNQRFQEEMSRSRVALDERKFQGSRQDALAAQKHQKNIYDLAIKNQNIAQQSADLAADKAEWGEIQDDRMYNQTVLENDLRQRQLDSNIANQKANQQMAANAEKRHNRLYEPSVQNLSVLEQISPEIYANPEFKAVVEQTMGGKLLDDGRVLITRPDGSQVPYTASKMDFETKVLPVLTGAMQTFDDAPARVEGRIADMTTQLEEMKSSLPNPGDPRNVGKHGQISAQIKEAESSLVAEKAKLTDENKMAYWMDRADDSRVLALSTAENKAVSDIFMKDAVSSETKANDMLSAKDKLAIEQVKQNAKEQDTYGKKAESSLENMFSMKGGTLIPGLPSQTNAKRFMITKMADAMAATPSKNEEEAIQHATRAYEFTRQTWNDLFKQSQDIVQYVADEVEAGRMTEKQAQVERDRALKEWQGAVMDTLHYPITDTFENEVELQGKSKDEINQLIQQYAAENQ